MAREPMARNRTLSPLASLVMALSGSFKASKREGRFEQLAF